jgi:hypothetical protein
MALNQQSDITTITDEVVLNQHQTHVMPTLSTQS